MKFDTTIQPVILCGGSGTRLWPKSRKAKPKPFLQLLGDETLFQQACSRCGDADIFAPPMVVAGAHHVPLIEQQAPAGGCSIIVEPAARNTAPAIALAAASLDPDAIMMVCPSDHHIADSAAFQEAAKKAAQLARNGLLVAFGITANRPETGYGYIKRGEALGEGYRIDRFVEKPDLPRAEQFLADGGYAWNGGIFVFRAGQLLKELATHREEMARAIEAAIAKGKQQGAQFHPDAESFVSIAGESIDYAVMENTKNAAMVPVAMGWSDIGDWSSLTEAMTGDGAGNSAVGPTELLDCQGVLAMSDGPRISAIGLDDVVIVVDGDEVMVTSRAYAQKVGKLNGATEQ